MAISCSIVDFIIPNLIEHKALTFSPTLKLLTFSFHSYDQIVYRNRGTLINSEKARCKAGKLHNTCFGKTFIDQRPCDVLRGPKTASAFIILHQSKAPESSLSITPHLQSWTSNLAAGKTTLPTLPVSRSHRNYPFFDIPKVCILLSNNQNTVPTDSAPANSSNTKSPGIKNCCTMAFLNAKLLCSDRSITLQPFLLNRCKKT